MRDSYCGSPLAILLIDTLSIAVSDARTITIATTIRLSAAQVGKPRRFRKNMAGARINARKRETSSGITIGLAAFIPAMTTTNDAKLRRKPVRMGLRSPSI